VNLLKSPFEVVLSVNVEVLMLETLKGHKFALHCPFGMHFFLISCNFSRSIQRKLPKAASAHCFFKKTAIVVLTSI